MIEEGWTKEILIVLATAGVVVPLFGKLKLGVVPGFLLAGLLLGPGGLGRLVGDYPFLSWFTVSDPERVQPFAELGVIFLLFVIGLEFSVARLWAMRRLVFGFGAMQFAVSAALIAGVTLLAGGAFPVALVIGLALALSSTAIATQLLIESRRFALPAGRATLGVLLFQDLMVVPIVIVVGLLGGEEIEASGALLRAVLFAAAGLGGILLAGRYLLRPLIRLAARTGSRELIVAIAGFVALGAAVLTASVGLSSALGAFLAGILLSESEYRHQIEVDIEPFKGLLLGLFFMTVGMSLDLAALTVGPLTVALALAGLLAAKAAIAFAAARAMGVATPVAAEAALLLAGAGEFAFVAFTLARGEGVFSPATLEFAVAVAVLSMFAIPLLAGLGRRLAETLEARLARAEHGVDGAGHDDLSDHVVIAGYGRVGRIVGRLLDAEGVPFVALDLDADLCARERGRAQVYFGDASRREILERLGAGRARAFVVTTDDPAASEAAVKTIRKAWPTAPLLARARDPEHAARLKGLGVSGPVPETLEGSLQIGRDVLVAVGLPEDAADTRVERLRDEERRRLGGEGA